MKILLSMLLVLFSVASESHFLRRDDTANDKEDPGRLRDFETDGIQVLRSETLLSKRENENVKKSIHQIIDKSDEKVKVDFNDVNRASAALGFKRELFFSGGDDINNLSPNVDLPLRLIVLIYDVALFPIWLPLIAIGGTGGATYNDLFSCVFGKSPFIPCLSNKNLISQEQYNCYQTSGVTWGCLWQGSIVNQFFPKASADQANNSTRASANSTRILNDFDKHL